MTIPADDRNRIVLLDWAGGDLRLVMESSGDDISIGLDGASAHAHVEILAELYGLSHGAAVEQYVQDIKEGRRTALILKKRAVVIDAWITDLPIDFFYDDSFEQVLEQDETLEVRKWEPPQ